MLSTLRLKRTIIQQATSDYMFFFKNFGSWLKNRPNLNAQLLLSFENGLVGICSPNRPKYNKSTSDFCFFQKLWLLVEKKIKSQGSTLTELRERSIWSFYILEDQNSWNPRKISIFSKKLNHDKKPLQIWSHNSFWALRTITLKFSNISRGFFKKFEKFSTCFLVPVFK